MVYGTIGIGEGLEIGDVFHVWIFPGKETLSLFKLFSNTESAVTVGRGKSAVVAVNATSGG
jgi:hypothetical protein